MQETKKVNQLPIDVLKRRLIQLLSVYEHKFNNSELMNLMFTLIADACKGTIADKKKVRRKIESLILLQREWKQEDITYDRHDEEAYQFVRGLLKEFRQKLMD